MFSYKSLNLMARLWFVGNKERDQLMADIHHSRAPNAIRLCVHEASCKFSRHWEGG